MRCRRSFSSSSISAGAAASLYALGYGRAERDPARVLPFFPAFLAGMNLALLAADAYDFLLSWEFMSLASWALVMAHHREGQIARAGYVYLVMASFGTLMLLVAFALLAGPDSRYGFAAIRAAPPEGTVAALAFIAALIGAGSKAGLVPLHVWLPLAHPAAPSHVSALMSGAMTKVAVYAFIRIAFDLAGPADWRLSVPVLVAGAASGIIGVLQALMDNDMKRVLAYSTIENIGLVFVALGLAAAFRAGGFGAAAALAMTAALLHAFNHSLFKSLLFFRGGRRSSRRPARSAPPARRPFKPNAEDRPFHAGRRGRDLGSAAAQRLRLGMDDPSGGAAGPSFPDWTSRSSPPPSARASR